MASYFEAARQMDLVQALERELELVACFEVVEDLELGSYSPICV